MIRAFVVATNIAHILTLVGCGLAIWGYIDLVRSLMGNVASDVTLAGLSLALVIVPYCLAGTLQRIVELELRTRTPGDRDQA